MFGSAKQSRSTDMLSIDLDITNALKTLKLGSTIKDSQPSSKSGVPVSGSDGEEYVSFARQASQAMMRNEQILATILAHVIMAPWGTAAWHEQQVRRIREDHRNMLRSSSPAANNSSANFESYKDEITQFLEDESLSNDQKRIRIQTFITRAQAIANVRILEMYWYMVAYDLLAVWSRFPPSLPNASSAETAITGGDRDLVENNSEESQRLRGMDNYLPFDDARPSGKYRITDLPEQNGAPRLDPRWLLEFHQNISFSARVWSWVLMDSQEIVMWLEEAARMVAYPFYMRICIDRGMAIYADMALYLRVYGDIMEHWVNWP